MQTQVFLFAAHFYSKEIIKEFKKIQNATRNLGPSIILYHQKHKEPIDRTILKHPHYIFTDTDLLKLKYPTLFPGLLMPGSNHLPLVKFSRKNFFQYYWYIEYDARFTGSWKDFILYFKEDHTDFLTSHLRLYAEEPQWPWWSSLKHPDNNIPSAKMIRSFNPVYRISFAALNYIDRMQSKRWNGHHEVMYPTLLFQKGFTLRDFGGCGEFVRRQDVNRFYIDSSTFELRDGTMRYLNPHSRLSASPKNKLIHPLKPHKTG